MNTNNSGKTKLISYAAIVFLASGFLTYLLITIFQIPFSDNTLLLGSSDELQAEWLLLIHQHDSSSYYFRLDPVTRLIAGLAPPALLLSYMWAVSSAGVFSLLSRNNPHTPVRSACLSLIPCLTSLVVFGPLLSQASALCWFPWFLYLASSQKFSPFVIFLAVGAGLLVLLSANQFAPLLLLTGSCLYYYVTSEKRPSLNLIFSLLPALAYAYSFLIPTPKHFDYPGNARVHVERSLISGLDPLVGPAPQISYTNRIFLREALRPVNPVLLLIGLGALLSVLRKRRTRNATTRFFLAAACTLAFSSFLSTAAVPQGVSLIGPLYSLERIFPGLVFVPLIYVALPLTALFLVSGVSGGKVQVILIASAGLLSTPILFTDSPRPVVYFPHTEGSVGHAAAVSPSHEIVAKLGPERLDAFKKIKSLRFQYAGRYTELARASHNEQRLGVTIHKKQRGRWSAGKGRQEGDEWISLTFKEPLEVEAIQLEQGPYSADFPRGLEISVSESCEEDSFQTAFRQEKWEGSINFTPNGFPFYEHESVVRVPLSVEGPFRCLVIKQIGATAHFDWSVTGIRLGFPATSKTIQEK